MKLKKCFSLLVVAIMVMMTSSLIAADVKVGPYVVTNNNDFASTLTGSAINSFEIKNGVLLITMASAGTVDPNFNIPLDMLSAEVDCSVYKAFAINVKLSAGGDNAYVYFDTDVNPGLSEDKNLSIEYANSTDWQTIIWDFSKNAKFDGTLTTLRLDPFGECKDVTYEIKWIAFFKTAAEAAAFNGVFATSATSTNASVPNVSVPNASATSAATSTSVASTSATTKSPTVAASKQPSPTKAAIDKSDGSQGLVISLIAGGIIIAAIVVFVVVKKKKQ